MSDKLEEFVKPIPFVESASLEETLVRDGVAEAESMASAYGMEGRERDLLVLGHAMRVNQDKNTILREAGDSTYGNPAEEYDTILADLGFVQILEIPFVGKDDAKNLFKIFWRDGILLEYDTYYSAYQKEFTVNGGSFYYNWKPNEKYYQRDGWVAGGITSSGHFDVKDHTGEPTAKEMYINYEKTADPVILEKERLWEEKWRRECIWVGSHDCRVAIKFNIKKLENYGNILPKWEFDPKPYLIHHGDFDPFDHDRKGTNELIQSRKAMLPAYVREAIGFKE